MSQAEELLNGMSEEVPVHTHPVPDTDTYFVIDPVTRKIENTNPKKHVIMQYDHNSERCTFELPRFIDGHDMLECTSVTVNVDNIEVVESEGVEEAEPVEPRINSDAPDMTDLRIHPNDPEKVISSWLISRNSTQLAGILSFHIEYKCVDSNGNVVYEWSTDNYDEYEIRARKKNGEAAVTPHIDTLEQWRTRIFGAGDSVMANIAAEGEAQVAAVKAESEIQQEAVELKGAQTLDTIPEDYTEVDAMADEAVRSKGDAIVCEAAGESIVIKDSSNDHIRGLKLFGKSKQTTTTGAQLFDIHDTLVTRYCTIVDDTVEIDYDNTEGTTIAYANYYTNLSDNISPSTDYLVVLEVISASGIKRIYAASLQDDVYKGQFSASHAVESPSVGTYVKVIKTNGSFDGCGSMCRGFAEILPGAVGKAKFRISVLADTSVTADTFKYEPYTGGKPAPNPEYPQEIVSVENPEVCICGKNLLDITKAELIVVGASGSKRYGIVFDKLGTYTFSCKTNEGIAVKVVTDGEYGDYVTLVGNVSHTFTLAENQYLIIYQGSEGKMFNAGLEDAQIELGNIATTYEPYKGRNLAIPHTLPGIPVISGGNYTDENGQQWICDEVDLERGVYVQRVAMVTIDDTYTAMVDVYPSNSDKHVFRYRGYNNPQMLHGGTIYHNSGYCNLFEYNDAPVFGNIKDCCAVVYGDVMAIRCDSFAGDVNRFAEWAIANALTIQYVLGIPIETPLTAEEITAFKALRTNYPHTTILNDAGAWMSVKYNADTKTYVENPKTLRLVDSSTGVVYELKIVNGSLTVNPV